MGYTSAYLGARLPALLEDIKRHRQAGQQTHHDLVTHPFFDNPKRVALFARHLNDSWDLRHDEIYAIFKFLDFRHLQNQNIAACLPSGTTIDATQLAYRLQVGTYYETLSDLDKLSPADLLAYKKFRERTLASLSAMLISSKVIPSKVYPVSWLDPQFGSLHFIPAMWLHHDEATSTMVRNYHQHLADAVAVGNTSPKRETDLAELDRRFAAFPALHERVFREHWLANLLSPTELVSVRDLPTTLLRELYPDIWTNGAALYHEYQLRQQSHTELRL